MGSTQLPDRFVTTPDPQGLCYSYIAWFYTTYKAQSVYELRALYLPRVKKFDDDDDISFHFGMAAMPFPS